MNTKVAHVKEFCERFGKSGAITFFIDSSEDTIGYVSYGVDKKKCATMQRIADALYDDFGEVCAQELLKEI